MAKKITSTALDKLLNYIADNGATMHICAGEPVDLADVGTKSLGSVSMTVGAGKGDYTLSDITNGRQLSIAAKSVNITADGTADHVAIVSATELLVVTTLTQARAVLNGDTVNLQGWNIDLTYTP